MMHLVSFALTGPYGSRQKPVSQTREPGLRKASVEHTTPGGRKGQAAVSLAKTNLSAVVEFWGGPNTSTL